MEDDFYEWTEDQLRSFRWRARRDALSLYIRELKRRWRYNLRAHFAIFITGIFCLFLSTLGIAMLASPAIFGLTPALGLAVGLSLALGGGLSGIFCMIHNAIARLPASGGVNLNTPETPDSRGVSLSSHFVLYTQPSQVAYAPKVPLLPNVSRGSLGGGSSGGSRIDVEDYFPSGSLGSLKRTTYGLLSPLGEASSPIVVEEEEVDYVPLSPHTPGGSLPCNRSAPSWK